MTQDTNTEHTEKFIIHVDPEFENSIPGFLEKRHKDVKTLKEALAKGDYENIWILGKAMRGPGREYGFEAITRLGQALENAAKEKDEKQVRNLTTELLNYLRRIQVTYK